MTRQSLHVLLVEDNPGDARLLRTLLSAVPADFTWVYAERLSAAIELLRSEPLDLVLLDLSLPDSQGLETFTRLFPHAICLPIVVLTGTDDETLALQAVQAGAQDYLVKGRLDGELLARALRYAVERKRSDAALRAKNREIAAMTQQLWQAAKLATMGELAASIAHELNNPLATVSLRVETLLGQLPPDDPKRSGLLVVQGEVERMGRLVANLLQFSRRSTTQVSTVDIHAELASTLDLVQYHLRGRNVVTAREMPPEALLVRVDRQQLRQVFLNLFTNAADAMPQGGTLTIRTQAATASGAASPKDPKRLVTRSLGLPVSRSALQVVVEISDTGDGIPPDVIAQVWEPFYTTKPEGKGTGLGLAICRRIVLEHGGTIEINSAGVPGKGTQIRITLPAAQGGP